MPDDADLNDRSLSSPNGLHRAAPAGADCAT